MGKDKKPINWVVFVPVMVIVGGAAILGLVNNKGLIMVASSVFEWTLINFSWLYQIATVTVLILMFVIFILLIFVIAVGPTVYCLNITCVGLGEWIDNFGVWGLDPGLVNGEALVTWWTMFAWSIWIAYAPIMGIFFAMISYGRTIREFICVNMLLPAGLNIIWIGFWGGTALNWQQKGKVDIVSTISEMGATAGLWEFIKNLPANVVVVPLMIVLLVCGFATTANATTTSMAVICTKGLKMNEEPARWMKWTFGVLIGIISGIMVCFGGGVQGVDGVKQLSAAGGFFVLFLFVLQIAAAFKVFFIDHGKVPEVYISDESATQEQGEKIKAEQTAE